MASELNHHVGYSRENKCWFVRFYPYQTEQQALDAIMAFTRPAPAATDTGLVTVEYQVRSKLNGHWVKDNFLSQQLSPDAERRELVTRSQAEELLAAEIRRERDLAARQLSEVVDRMSDDYLALKADNAAKAARINFLERIWKKAESRADALEAKLAAAEKALEFYADQENWKNGRFEQVDGGTVLRHYPASAHKDRGETARAVLGGKP